MNSVFKKILFIFFVVFLFLSCSQIKNITFDDVVKVGKKIEKDTAVLKLFSVENDVALGQKLDEEMKRNPKDYPFYIYNQPIQYLQDIVNKIISSPLIKYRNIFKYKVQIIADDNVINAFCTPGGYIYVYTGLIRSLKNEASLAAVLAHEIAHAELRHAKNRMLKAYGVDLIKSIIVGENPDKLKEMAGNFFSGTYLMKNSRDDEYESDEYSFKYLQSTQWYPGAIKYFFDVIKSDVKPDFVERLKDTHPIPQERIENIDKMLKDAGIKNPDEKSLRTMEYKLFVKTMP
ncbi:MAG: M48 family metalloprotease [Candidatus Kapabacteria bacterium]|nr:M48 family metalloprotease [Candidatus Kapabacteria bacterium]